MTLLEMELAIKNLQNDVKNLASKRCVEKTENVNSDLQKSKNKIDNELKSINTNNDDVLEAVAELALVIGTEVSNNG